jgi:hypothetical protein
MAASNLDITRRVAAMTSAAYLAERIPAAIDGAGLSGGDYASAFARELSRELIAFTANIYAPAAPLDLQTAVPVLGSRLPLPLLVLMLIWILAYWYARFAASSNRNELTALQRPCAVPDCLRRAGQHRVAVHAPRAQTTHGAAHRGAHCIRARRAALYVGAVERASLQRGDGPGPPQRRADDL